jgi:urate oxidase
MIELGPNRYGKSAIRLVKVDRGSRGGLKHHGDRVRDLTIAISLEGDFESAHTEGDNSNVIATDTMKNTAYALAADGLTGSIEDFGRLMTDHFLEAAQVSRATVTIDEHNWSPIDLGGERSDHAFQRIDAGTRTATIIADRAGTTVEAGVRALTVMKTTRSGFAGFPRDRFTTLPEVDDRILATRIDATWRYRDGTSGFDELHGLVRARPLQAFAEHHSPSVQASIWIVGREILDVYPEVAEIRMRMPNLHHWRIDLEAFGIEGERDLYVATTEPHGLIEATLRRGDQSG